MKHSKRRKIKLNLGSGTDYRQGYINVDIHTEYKPDVVADLRKDLPFDNNSAEEIIAQDILEHFTKEEGERFIEECRRVLTPEGKLLIRTPNIFRIFSEFGNDPEVVIHFMYGDSSRTGEWGAHKFGYTRESLTRLLKLHGFKSVDVHEETTNFVVYGVKKKQHELPLMHIAIVQQSPDIGGAETFMHSIAEGLLRKHHRLRVITNKGAFYSYIEKLSIPMIPIPIIVDIGGNLRGGIKTLFLFSVVFVWYLKTFIRLKKEKTDILLVSGFSEKLLSSWFAYLFKIPVVWTEYGNLEPIFKRNFYIPKIMYRLTRGIPYAVIVPSSNTKSLLMRHARVSLAKIRYIPCGIDTQKIKSKKPRDAFLKNRFIIGSVSRLTREKGQEYIIRAMKEVVKKVPSAHLLLVGDGPDKRYYEQVVQTLELEKYITITGFVENIDSYYSIFDIFVFATVWEMEGFGLVSIEAMNYRIPVVAVTTPPITEIIDKTTGMLVPPADPDALAQAIIFLYQNPFLRKELGEKGEKKVKQQYDIRIITEQFEKILYEATLV